jgi:biotin carboxylase
MRKYCLLSIGAGEEQIYPIQVAKSMGFNVVAVDNNHSASAKSYADKFYHLDITDKEKLLGVTKKHKIIGVLPSPIGRILHLTGYINDSLFLKGINEKVADICTDKKLLYSLYNDKINLPRQKIFPNSTINYDEFLKDLKLPVIVKPDKGSGNRGIMVASCAKQLKKAINYCNKSLQKGEKIIVETFIEGVEYGISGYVTNNKFKLLLVREKRFTEFPFRQEVKYIIDKELEQHIRHSIENYVNYVALEVGLNDCLIQADLIIDKNRKIWLIEIAGRPSGHNVSRLIIPECLNLSFIETGINIICNGQIPEHVPKPTCSAIFSFFDFSNKTVRKIPNDTELKSIEGLVECNINFSVNTLIRKIKNGRDAALMGYYFIKGTDLKSCEHSETLLLSLFKLD